MYKKAGGTMKKNAKKNAKKKMNEEKLASEVEVVATWQSTITECACRPELLKDTSCRPQAGQ